MSEGPRVLILGGLGMIGKALISYIVTYRLASYVRVVDKVVVPMAYLTPELKKLYADPCVEVVQANLAMPDHVKRAFDGPRFNLVINLAAETRFGLDMMYEQLIKNVRILCAAEAASTSVDKYLEVSTCQVYEPKNTPAKENSPLKPWTSIATYHLEAERAVQSIPKLNYIILRLPIVYGPGDVRGLMPRLVCAAVYESMKETMTFLWGEDLRINTVHVQDVAAAIWHLMCAGAIGEIYNLVDDNDTTQGKLNAMLEKLFKIKTNFVGSLSTSILTKATDLEKLVEDANDDHIGPWEEMCRASKILDTPISPFLEKELLYNNHLRVDGSKMKQLGFQCSCIAPTPELLAESMDYWKQLGLFPKAM